MIEYSAMNHIFQIIIITLIKEFSSNHIIHLLIEKMIYKILLYAEYICIILIRNPLLIQQYKYIRKYFSIF